MAKSPCCAETTHHSKAALRLNVLYIVYVLSQEYGILTSTLEEMCNLKYFLNHRCVHAPLSHVRFTFNTTIRFSEG